MASTVKVAIAALYLAQVDNGRRSLDDTINGQSARSLMAPDADPQRQSSRPTSCSRTSAARPRSTTGSTTTASPGLRVDRTIAQLLHSKRDLWDRRDSSTPVAMVDLLRRIYKAELIKPESRNYLLDLMAQCQTGKNRMKAMLPGRSDRAQDRDARWACRRRRLHHHARRPPGCGRDLHPRREPTARERSPRPRARFTTDSSRSSPGRSAARRSAPPSRCCSTSLRAGRSAALRRPSWSIAI